jgi:hypothetical protein
MNRVELLCTFNLPRPRCLSSSTRDRALGEHEELLWDIAMDMEPEHGCLWVHDADGQQTAAFTLNGIQSGLSVVILDAPGRGDERGSFLMDHVPRVPIHREGDGWSDADIFRGLNLLVDESLKRVVVVTPRGTRPGQPRA